ncbi:hypothetical protein BLNAU_11130 [Blattamonas nauphoetae]|uniref:Uncharacterized protein n=1 Tax=Blattamonas nauphoetae TaxID=2049346 RepID=A0ABQ9XQR9_9EUKA|nr:hypothetical protein BLNAU_11130 [Blattamonas nauphoetae]
MFRCSPSCLVNADLIPQLVNTLNALSLSFDEAVDIHTNLPSSILSSLWLATPNGLTQLGIEDENEQQSVRETVLKQVSKPLEKYIWHLSMDFVVNMPVVLTIPSCLTFFENEYSIWDFLDFMNKAQREWNEIREARRQMWKTVLRMLRMEGMEDMNDEKLRNDKNSIVGGRIVDKSIVWNNLQGMNLLKKELKQARTSDSCDQFLPSLGQHTLVVCDLCRLWHHLMVWFAETIWLLSCHSPSMAITLSFSFDATLALRKPIRKDRKVLSPNSWPFSIPVHSPPTPSLSPLPLPHHPHPPSPPCLSLTTHTLPLHSASPSPPTPSLSTLPLPHHPHLPPLCLPHHPHPPSPPCLPHHPHPPTLPLPHNPHPPSPSASPTPPTPFLSLCLSLTTHTSLSLCLSLTTHTLPLPLPLPHHSHPPLPLPLPHHPHPPTPSASPSPPTPSHSPLPLPHNPHLPLPSASPSPPTPSLSTLPLPHHSHPPTPSASPSQPTPSLSLCLSLTTHTLPLPLPLPHHPHPPTPLPLPHHPHPPSPLCLSLTTHTLPLPSASPSPPTPSHSLCLSLTTHTLPLPLPLPHHPYPPTPLCLSLTSHILPLPSASPSPLTPSHSPLPLPHNPHPPTPLCLPPHHTRESFITWFYCLSCFVSFGVLTAPFGACSSLAKVFKLLAPFDSNQDQDELNVLRRVGEIVVSLHWFGIPSHFDSPLLCHLPSLAGAQRGILQTLSSHSGIPSLVTHNTIKPNRDRLRTPSRRMETSWRCTNRFSDEIM